MRGRFSAAIAMVLALGASATQPLTDYTERPGLPKKSAGKRKSLGLFSWRNNPKHPNPHQGAKEIARRKRQIERGILKVSC